MKPLPNLQERIRWAIDLLDVRPADAVLEIGCGAGHAVALVAGRLKGGSIMAIDRSAVMVARARAVNAEAIAERRVQIERLTLAEAAKVGDVFHKVFAVNVNAFWTEPAAALAALARLVRPRGTACLVFEPPGVDRLRAIERELPVAMQGAGFDAVDVRTYPASNARMIAIVARRSAGPHLRAGP